MEKKFLTEENYERGKEKIKKVATIVLVAGLLFGGSLIATGIVKQASVNSKYSDSSKANLREQLEKEKQVLSLEEERLEDKIEPIEDEIKRLNRAKFNGFDEDYYARMDKIEELQKTIKEDKKTLDLIDDVLDDEFPRCKFDEAKNNSYTAKYCSLKNQLGENNDFNRRFNSSKYIAFYVFGGFIIFATLMISGSIYLITKRREILAFSAQQVMPVAKEGIDEMAPTIGDAAKTIGKGLASGIASGIKEGLKSDEEEQNDTNDK